MQALVCLIMFNPYLVIRMTLTLGYWKQVLEHQTVYLALSSVLLKSREL